MLLIIDVIHPGSGIREEVLQWPIRRTVGDLILQPRPRPGAPRRGDRFKGEGSPRVGGGQLWRAQLRRISTGRRRPGEGGPAVGGFDRRRVLTGRTGRLGTDGTGATPDRQGTGHVGTLLARRFHRIHLQRGPLDFPRVGQIRRALQAVASMRPAGRLGPRPGALVRGHGSRLDGPVLHVGHHRRVLDVVLLHRVIRAEGEQRGGGTVIGHGPHVANGFDHFIRDVLRLDIPNPCFSVFGRSDRVD